jgi:uncharacterized protein YegP (UPF0339 family)
MRRGKTTVFKGSDDQWYWSFRSGNGEISATGNEPYVSASNARRAARKIGLSMIAARVETKYE